MNPETNNADPTSKLDNKNPDNSKMGMLELLKPYLDKIKPILAKNKKVIILVTLLLFFILLLLISSLVASRKQQDTTIQKPQETPKVELNKSRYINYTYNYSIKIPDGWTVEEGGFSFIGSAGEVALTKKEDSGELTVIGITVMPNGGGRYKVDGQETFKSWLEKDLDDPSGKNLYKYGDSFLAGIPAVQFVDQSLETDPGKHFFRLTTWIYTNKILPVSGAGNFWNIYIEIGDDPNLVKKYQEIYNDLISSFAFVNPSEETPPPLEESSSIELDTVFEDEDFDYQIFYPSAWNLNQTVGEDLGNSDDSGLLSSIEITFSEGDRNLKMVIDVFDSQNLTDVEDWINIYDFNYPKSTDKRIENFKGNRSVRLIFDQDPGDKEKIYFINKYRVFRISYEETPKISPDARKVINSLNPNFL